MPDSSPPPRIGFNALLLSADPGYRAAGIHRHIVSLLGAMAEIGNTSVVAFVPSSWPVGALPPAIDLWRAPGMAHRPWARVLWEQLGLPSALVRAGADLYHGAAYAMPAAARCPSVVTVHDLSPFRHADGFPRWQGAYLRTATRHAARSADALIAVSHFTATEIGDVLGVPSGKVHVVPNGVDVRFGRVSDRDAEDVRRRLRLPQRYLLTLGTLEPRKNLRTLLQAYAAVRAERPDAPDLMVVGGAGWGGVDANSMAAQLHIAPHVGVLGYVADDDLPALYAGATAFAYPSRYEGFGLPVLEAMASGTPSVVASGSSLTEVSGDDALAASPDDVGSWSHAILTLLDDDALRARLAANGRARAAQYTWARAAASTRDVYDLVLERRGGHRIAPEAPRG